MKRESIFDPENVAVVTGTAHGIGRALALQLVGMGMSVVMADLKSGDFDDAVETVRTTAKRGPETVLGVVTDVSSYEQISELKTATLDDFGTVDLLVNNAVTRIGRGF